MKLSIETTQVLEWFSELSKIPRKSGNEHKVRQWLSETAGKNAWHTKSDAAGNIVLSIPATSGFEDRNTLVIQGHMDMVCEKTPDSSHDFSKDPIELVYDGDWLRANKTTLGSDNGIAIALALAMVTNKNIPHPKLELLFTTNEETGLNGALGLENGFLTGKILLNVDSEDEGVFTIGCAGGMTTHITIPGERANNLEKFEGHFLTIAGLRGGHSGVNIQDQRANALKLMFRTLQSIASNCPDMLIGDCGGGTAHNAIPRESYANIFLTKGSREQLNNIIKILQRTLSDEYSVQDSGVRISVEAVEARPSTFPFNSQSTRKFIDFGISMPHGVAAVSEAIKGLVETSNNLAKVWIDGNAINLISSQRSTVMSRLAEINQRIESLARLAGGTLITSDGYPAWEPHWQSPLLAKCKNTYKGLFGKDPIVEVIHAGLECGVIGAKFPGMDMISFGPTIKNPHTPSETLFIPDIDKIWKLMAGLFQAL